MVMSHKKILDELISLRGTLVPAKTLNKIISKGKSCDDSVDLYIKIDKLVVDELNDTPYWWGLVDEYKEKNNEST